MGNPVQYKDKHYAENRDYYAEKNRTWIKENKDRYLANAKQYREENKEKVKESLLRWSSKKPLYGIWRGMKRRCYDPKCDHYYLYGARGVKVCARWLGDDGYNNFAADMGVRPSCKHSIERIDTNGIYEPNNCTWATAKEQQRNRRANRLITIDGITRCLTEWSEISGIGFKTIEKRIKNGWDESRLLSPPDPQFKTAGNRKNSSNHVVGVA